MPNSSDSRRERLRQAIAFTVVITATRLCLAAPESGESADAKSHATELFQQARDAMKAEQYETACAKLEESERLVPAPGTLLNLAACNEKLGRFVAALAALRKAEDSLQPDDSRRDYVTTETKAVESKVARLTIFRAQPTSGQHVSLDESELSQEALAAPLLVDPGTHHVTVTAPAHEKATYDVTLAEGQEQTLTSASGAPVLASPVGGIRSGREARRRRRARGASVTHWYQHARSGLRRARRRRPRARRERGDGHPLRLNKKSTINDHCDKTFACDRPTRRGFIRQDLFDRQHRQLRRSSCRRSGVGLYLLLTATDDPQRPMRPRSSHRTGTVETSGSAVGFDRVRGGAQGLRGSRTGTGGVGRAHGGPARRVRRPSTLPARSETLDCAEARRGSRR